MNGSLREIALPVLLLVGVFAALLSDQSGFLGGYMSEISDQTNAINHRIDALRVTVSHEMQRSRQELRQGFSRVTHELEAGFGTVERAIRQLDRSIDTGFGRVIEQLVITDVSVQELVALARSPAHTAALEHYRVARDTHQRGLLPETLELLRYAIDGVPGVSTGYRTDWRFHALRGIVRLGLGPRRDPTIEDPTAAYEDFILAFRYLDESKHEQRSGILTCAGKAKMALGTAVGDEQAMALFAESVRLYRFNVEAMMDMARVSVRLRREHEGCEHVLTACRIDLHQYAVAERDPGLATYAIAVQHQKHERIASLHAGATTLETRLVAAAAAAEQHARALWLAHGRRVGDDPLVRQRERLHSWQVGTGATLSVTSFVGFTAVSHLEKTDYLVYLKVKPFMPPGLAVLVMFVVGLVLVSVAGSKATNRALRLARSQAAMRLQNELSAAAAATRASMAEATSVAHSWVECVTKLHILGAWRSSDQGDQVRRRLARLQASLEHAAFPA